MASDYAERRRAAIEAAAHDVLAEKGYKAASMLEIARRAGASNETLYKWYGNKQGLFRALVEANARQVAQVLGDHLAAVDDGDVFGTREEVGPLLLKRVTGARAVALNRAAVGDVHDTGTLGPTLAAAGRDSIVPMIDTLLRRGRQAGELRFADDEPVAEIYISLLIGDWQVRRATGALDEPGERAIADRSRRAIAIMRRLYATAR